MVMNRPIIGLTMDSGDKANSYSLNSDYTTSVEKAGGIPLAIPFHTDHSLIPRIVDALDGSLSIGADAVASVLHCGKLPPQAFRIGAGGVDCWRVLMAGREEGRLREAGA